MKLLNIPNAQQLSGAIVQPWFLRELNSLDLKSLEIIQELMSGESQQSLDQILRSLDHLGLVIVDIEKHIELITPLASEWLQTYLGQSINSDRLPECLWRWISYQVGGLKNNYFAEDVCLSLRIRQSERQLEIRLVIEDRGERYLLLMEEQSLSLSYALELLGLSKREMEVLFWLIRGKDNQAIARKLDVGISTVRKHLESIYLKLEVQSRTEAIAKTLEQLGVLPKLLRDR
ncbi:MAG: helix-turn-helix transcriptional regulator [Waterburya sp.]